jgi:hypothetical protein
MRMLNYPFPSDSGNVQMGFAAMTHALATALSAAGGSPLDRAVRDFWRAHEKFRSSIVVDARRYFEFQLWQDGVATYTELRLAELATEAYAPSAAFRSLADYTHTATWPRQL